MKTIIESNDLVYINWIENILKQNFIKYHILDKSMAITEGNISAIPIRVLVNHENENLAKKLIEKAEKDLQKTN